MYSYQYLCAKYLRQTLQPLMRSVVHAAYPWERKCIQNFGQKMWMETILKSLRCRKCTATLRHWTAVSNALCITWAFKCPTHNFAFKCTTTIVILWCQRVNEIDWKDVPVIHLTQDRVQWQALVNLLIYLCFHKRLQKVLNRWSIISSQKRFFHH